MSVLVDDSSGVCIKVGGVVWVYMCVGVQGGGLQGYGFCCDNLDYGFYFLDIKKKIQYVFCLLLSV